MPKTIAFVLGLILSSCSYVVIPHKYYTDYTKVLNENNLVSNDLNIKSNYVVVDSFLTKAHAKSGRGNVTAYKYIFLYKNNLMATINIPVFENGKLFIFSENELSDSIKNGYFYKQNNISKVRWTYYSIENNKLIKHLFTYDIGSGANALTKVKLTGTTYLIENGNLIDNYSRLVNNAPATSVKDIYIPSSISQKPDSTKSYFLKMYDNYKVTGVRKYYPPTGIKQ